MGIFKRLVNLLIVFVIYWYDIAKSSVAIAIAVLGPKDISNPGIVIYPLDAKSDLEIGLFCNMVTFSPGSMVLRISEDRKTIDIHVMFLRTEADFINELKNNLELKLLEVLR